MSEPPRVDRKLVLVVEDDDALRDEVCEVLRCDGHRVLAARDGKRALAVLSQLTPHLILLDLMLPEVNGWEVLAVLSATPALADIPVVVMSAYADYAPLQVAQVLRKPMSIDALRDAVRRSCS
jgi:CheY-like chemotaxis protein